MENPQDKLGLPDLQGQEPGGVLEELVRKGVRQMLFRRYRALEQAGMVLHVSA